MSSKQSSTSDDKVDVTTSATTSTVPSADDELKKIMEDLRLQSLLKGVLDYLENAIVGTYCGIYRGKQHDLELNLAWKTPEGNHLKRVYIETAINYLNSTFQRLIEGKDPAIMEPLGAMLQTHSPICLMHNLAYFVLNIHDKIDWDRISLNSRNELHDSLHETLQRKLNAIAPFMYGMLVHEDGACRGPKCEELNPNTVLFKIRETVDDQKNTNSADK